MIKCKKCKKENYDDTPCCVNCGASLKNKKLSVCPDCGESSVPQSRFCANCGASLRFILLKRIYRFTIRTIKAVVSRTIDTVLRLNRRVLTGIVVLLVVIAGFMMWTFRTIPVERIDSDYNVINIPVGQTHQIYTAIKPANATNKQLSWMSSSPDIASVCDSGIVTAYSPGKAVITISADSGKMSIQRNVRSYIKATELTMSQPHKILTAGSTYQLECHAKPENADKELSWKSSDTDAVWVSSDGKLTAVGEGKSTITVTDFLSGKIATCVIESSYRQIKKFKTNFHSNRPEKYDKTRDILGKKMEKYIVKARIQVNRVFSKDYFIGFDYHCDLKAGSTNFNQIILGSKFITYGIQTKGKWIDDKTLSREHLMRLPYNTVQTSTFNFGKNNESSIDSLVNLEEKKIPKGKFVLDLRIHITNNQIEKVTVQHIKGDPSQQYNYLPVKTTEASTGGKKHALVDLGNSKHTYSTDFYTTDNEKGFLRFSFSRCRGNADITVYEYYRNEELMRTSLY